MVRSVACSGSLFFSLVVYRLSVVQHGPLVGGLDISAVICIG